MQLIGTNMAENSIEPNNIGSQSLLVVSHFVEG